MLRVMRGTSGWRWAPGSHGAQRQAGEEKLLPRMAEVFRSGRSIRTRIQMFRVCVAILLSYKAQFVEAGPRLPQVYRRATQRITGAPWMCYSKHIIEHVTLLGIPAHIPSLPDYLHAHLVRAKDEQHGRVGGRGLVIRVGLPGADSFRIDLIVFR